MANATIDSWDNLTSGSFLKVSDVASEQVPFICISAEVITVKDKQRVQLSLENAGRQFKYDLNSTNTKFLKAQVATPKAVIGKKIFFRKVMANNPITKKEVESLRILKIE